MYDLNKQITVITDEDAQCRYTINKSIGCDFDFSGNLSVLMIGETKTHTSAWIDNQEYYIKCQDKFENTNALCGIVIRAR